MDVTVLMQFLGVTFIGLGLAARLNVWRAWYWQTRGTVYGYLPLGVLFLLFSFREQLEGTLGIATLHFNILAGLLVAVGIWWTVRPPSLLKPMWVRWIEKHPKRIQTAMREAVREGEEWKDKIGSEKAIKRWARRLKSRPQRSRRR